MWSGWSQFAAEHWIAGGILTSLLWIIAGKQSFSNRKSDFAIGWYCGAILILVILCCWAVARGEWLGFACAASTLYFEVRSLRCMSATSGK